MNIERSSLKSILPEASDALVTSGSINLYCNEYDPPKRPPLGIYNITLHKVISNFVSVLDSLDFIQTEEPFRNKDKYGSNFDASLIKSQESLIKSIQEHFDGCMDVIRCFYPATIGNKNKLFWKENSVDTYWNAIKDLFFEPISNIANHIKHDEGRLIFFVMFNEEHSIPGYYAEALDEHGRLAPYRKIHAPVRSKMDSNAGYDTAFSFFRDLRYLLWGIYFVSHHLANAINNITGSKATIQYAEAGNLDKQILEVCRRVEKLPKRFYQDELLKDTPTIQVSDQEHETILRMKYPSEDLLIASHGIHQNLVLFVGDGVSKEYKLPYWVASKL